MIEVGKKDRLFVAVALPLALLAGHFYFVRGPLVRERAALAAERARLPDPDMFSVERRTLQTKVAEAEKGLSAARAEKPPESAVRGRPDDSEAARQQAVVDALRAKGVRIAKVEPVEGCGSGGDVLRATGVRPEPVVRRIGLEASYPALVEALGEFEARRLAVVPETLSMTSGGTSCRWEVTLWL